MTMKLSTSLFAFWEYDKFPYVLGSEVLDMRPDGRVEVKGYAGFAFKPIKLLPLAAGRELCEKLGVLEEEYLTERATLTRKFKLKLDRLFNP